MKESALVRNIMAAVRAKYPKAYVRKIADRFTRGIPDILIVFGRDGGDRLGTGVLFVEAKTDDGRVSQIQEAEHAAILGVGAFGCYVTVARNVESVLAKLALMGAIA